MPTTHLLSTGVSFDNTDLGGQNSELLDEYEEGTYTHTAVGSTSGSMTFHSGYNEGKYTKIGRLVHNQGFVSSQSGTCSGTIHFGLTHSSGSGEGFACTVHVEPYRLDVIADIVQINGHIIANAAYFYLIQTQDNGEPVNITSDAWTQNSSAMRWSFMFSST